MILEDGRIQEHGQRQILANDPNSRFSQLLATGLETENSLLHSINKTQGEVLA